MFAWLMALLSIQSAQTPPVDLKTILPDEGVGDCIAPLFNESLNVRFLVRCESVQNGAPMNCDLQTGRSQPVRQRQAARCMARLYRFEDANGRPATSGAVVIPVTLRMNVPPNVAATDAT